jgi:hypothetical protein
MVARTARRRVAGNPYQESFMVQPSHPGAFARALASLRPSAPALTAVTAAAALFALSAAHATPQVVTITVENLAPASGIAFAPLHFGFNSGVFDAFDIGSVATAPIISVAEGGSGADWHPAFAAADPGAVRGTVGGLLLAGATASLTVVVDPAVNPFFTFAAMVVPSNDFFIGNDSPTRYRVFADDGTLLLSSIDQRANQIWDAGSEVFDPAAAPSSATTTCARRRTRSWPSTSPSWRASTA